MIGAAIGALAGLGAKLGIGKAIVGSLPGLFGGFLQRRFEARREDTAVQRRVADLSAAGLSPTLAAGSAAASGGYTNPMDQAQAYAQLIQAKKNIDVTEAQRELIELQKDRTRQEANYLYHSLPARVGKDSWELEKSIHETKSAEADWQTRRHNLEYAKKFAVPTTGADFKTRMMSTLYDVMSNLGSRMKNIRRVK